MMDLIIFSVDDNFYSIDVDNIYRIIKVKELSVIPNSDRLIDGMISYEGSVVKVLNFRKLTGMTPYEDEIEELCVKNIKSHKQWMAALKDSVVNGSKFTKELDSTKCELGKWLKDFNSYDDDSLKVIKELTRNHKYLHDSAEGVLAISKSDKKLAEHMVDTEIKDISLRAIESIKLLHSESKSIADSLQKLILYKKDNTTFAIKVDAILDIVSIEESKIIHVENEESENEYLELLGAIDIKGNLIDVIKSINIPK